MKEFHYSLPGLNNKIAIVTGHKSGIGKATKELLENLGAKVVGFDLPEINLKNLDLINSHIQNVVSEFGTIDILINNAGITTIGDIVETSLEDIEDVLTINFKAPFLLMKSVIPIMKKTKVVQLLILLVIRFLLGKNTVQFMVLVKQL